jgi:pimeloyl-ACP methyl ester carboxylesterase
VEEQAIRPIVFVHGVRSSADIWRHQVAEMTADGHPCRTVDLPGHGARLDERFTLEAAQDAIDEAVRSCASPPLLVGLSLGGYSSLAYAAGHQGRLAGLVLAACTAEVRSLPVDLYRRVSDRVVRLAQGPGTTWDVVTDMLASMRHHSFLDDMRRLHRPVWLVNGRRDLMRLDERRYVAAHPRARLTVIPDAGHDVPLHAPGPFTRVLREAARALRAPLVGLPA